MDKGSWRALGLAFCGTVVIATSVLAWLATTGAANDVRHVVAELITKTQTTGERTMADTSYDITVEFADGSPDDVHTLVAENPPAYVDDGVVADWVMQDGHTVAGIANFQTVWVEASAVAQTTWRITIYFNHGGEITDIKVFAVNKPKMPSSGQIWRLGKFEIPVDSIKYATIVKA